MIERIVRPVSLNEQLTVNYSGSQICNNNLYPKKINIKTSDDKLAFELIFNKITTHNSEKLFFKIPKNYNETN